MTNKLHTGTGQWAVDIRPEDTPWQLWGEHTTGARCKLDCPTDFRGRSALLRARDVGFAYKCYRFSVAEYTQTQFLCLIYLYIMYTCTVYTFVNLALNEFSN